jgi:hypothetical protein
MAMHGALTGSASLQHTWFTTAVNLHGSPPYRDTMQNDH